MPQRVAFATTLVGLLFGFVATPAQLVAQSYLINTVYRPTANQTLSGLAVDASGDIFVGSTDASGFGEVLRISPSGTVLIVAGGGNSAVADGALATSVSLFPIYSLAVDPTGTTLYFETPTNFDSGTEMLYRVDPNGAIHPMPSVSPLEVSIEGFCPASCMAVDKGGNLFVVTTHAIGFESPLDNTVLRVTPDGSITTYAGGEGLQGDGVPATSVEISASGVAIAADGTTVLILEGDNRDIRRVTPDGVISSVISSISTDPLALAADGLGNIYFSSSTISSISSSGVVQIIAGGGTSAATGVFATDAAITATFIAASWQSIGGPFVLIDQNGIQKLTPTTSSPSCAYTFGPASNLSVPAIGSGATPLSVQVSASSPYCPWTATANQTWIGITSGSAGTGNGSVNYVVTANTNAASRSGSISIGGLSFEITQFGTGPTLSSVSNSASFAQSFAPGMLMSVFGTGLSSGSPETAAITPLPLVSSSGTSVTVNGIAAPLLYISATQINLQLPYEVQTGNAVLTVSSGGQYASISFIVQAAAPGIFVDLQTGHMLPNESAAAGSTIGFYVTGVGLVNPSEQTGNIPTVGATPIPDLPITMTVGGVPVTPVYAGIPSWSVGVLQIDFKVPSTLAAGTQPVVVTIGAVASPPALLTVTP